MDKEVARFIRSGFRSIWSLELLLLLRRERRPWSREELIAALRASELVISNALDLLVAGGLVSLDADGAARYTPVSPAVDKLVGQTGDLYARKPDAVRRMIISAASSSLTAFADAFRLRED